MTADLAASIRARLLDGAKARGEDFNLTLNRYAIERYLFRLSISPWRDRFLLKGALLFDLWFDEPHRPTRDADFLGFGPGDAKSLEEAIRAICAIAADDGLTFDAESIRIDEIREEARYGGLRARLGASLGSSRCSLQLDVGFGDAVTPESQEVDYPTLLEGFPSPRLRAYPRETMVAEKLEAIVSLGMGNSRMKDYFDIRALAREGAVDAAFLARAIAATFQRRGTPIPEATPLGLSDEFARDPAKLRDWKAFLGKSRLEAPELPEVVAEVRAFVERPVREAAIGANLPANRRMSP